MSETNLVPRGFQEAVRADAERYLVSLVGVDRAKEAAGQIGLAFAAAVQSAKNPQDLLNCSPASIVNCIALSAVTRLYPGGANPTVFLVPKKGTLQWWITHRGIAVLAMRAGVQIIAVPVHTDDSFAVGFGEATNHEPDPDSWPDSLNDLRGVYVNVRRIADGANLGRPWLPAKAIAKRAAKAQNDGVWREWPVEQAQKTAIKWAMSRGYIPVESPELAIALDNDHEMVEIRRERGDRSLPALPDHGEVRDFAAEAQRLAEREKVGATIIPTTEAPAPMAATPVDAPDHASWPGAAATFGDELDRRGVTLADLEAYCRAKNKPSPRALTDAQRAKLLAGLDQKRADFDAWVAAQVPAVDGEYSEGAAK